MEKRTEQYNDSFYCGSGYNVNLVFEKEDIVEIEVVIDQVVYPVDRYSTLDKITDYTKEEAIQLLTPSDSYEDACSPH